MKLKITSSEAEGASVVDLEGRIVLGEESVALREKVKSLIAEGNKNIVLNMDHMEYIDSTGLGILVSLHVSARAQGGTLKLSNLGPRFHEILRITKLVKVFEVLNLNEALSLQGRA